MPEWWIPYEAVEEESIIEPTERVPGDQKPDQDARQMTLIDVSATNHTLRARTHTHAHTTYTNK